MSFRSVFLESRKSAHLSGFEGGGGGNLGNAQKKIFFGDSFLSNKGFVQIFLTKDLPDVYTRVSYFLPWINATILSNGGLASCDYSLTALPVQGDHDKSLALEALFIFVKIEQIVN